MGAWENIQSILQSNGYNQKPIADKTQGQFNIGNFDIQQMQQFWHPQGRPTPAVAQKDQGQKVTQQKQPGLKDQATAAGIQALSSTLADKMTDGMFGDSYIGQNLANIFSQGVASAGNTMATNLVKGQALTQGLGQNVGQSIQGAALGLGANLVGQGINSIGGDTRLSRGIGQGVATGLVNMKGITNSFKAIKTAAKAGKAATDAQKAASLAGKTNLAGIGGQVLGAALGAATGPSKEYGGKYGGITQKADMVYDLGTAAVGFIPGGQVLSGALALNKGLSNLFGSTDGMTVQDAILGSAFMPAPVKWLNMAGATTVGTFNNQSWQNQQKVDSFMGNAFGNLGDKFSKAREEAGKTYGTFSSGAATDAQQNINFANTAWDQVMNMANQNELQNIRSQYMTSINNQRYAQQIGGAYQPISRGRYGMKILNNATNHNIGMRLLSGAALIDNKQMILCSVVD